MLHCTVAVHLLSPEVALFASGAGAAGCSFASKGPERDWNLVCLFSSHSCEPNSVFPSSFHILSVSLKTRAFGRAESGSFLRLNAANSHYRQKQASLCYLCAE